MLRISVTEGHLGQRWILQGRLTKCSVAELARNWQAHRAHPPAQRCVIDLKEVTSIDRSGEQVLSMMIRDGAEFVAAGVYTRHLLETLKARFATTGESE
jgi:hypothetical protein